jgi:hypothetical protein
VVAFSKRKEIWSQDWPRSGALRPISIKNGSKKAKARVGFQNSRSLHRFILGAIEVRKEVRKHLFAPNLRPPLSHATLLFDKWPPAVKSGGKKMKFGNG